jgi:hypothetical protein
MTLFIQGFLEAIIQASFWPRSGLLAMQQLSYGWVCLKRTFRGLSIEWACLLIGLTGYLFPFQFPPFPCLTRLIGWVSGILFLLAAKVVP